MASRLVFRYRATWRTAGVPGSRHPYTSPLTLEQKLMWHADIRTTMNVYGDDVAIKQEAKALAQISALTLGKQQATARTLKCSG